ncbi:MAG TPA: tRNA pseudouridine(38-40) synthase TruA [Roseiflexaceae bacterium]|nr:tRNA pseudouridine(38-40) synthase TruA [Roseiflexaceae bacterium]HMP39864.1 tRNA pseudouridine(38-40) synthase TruA [Roseiflexaceae bacterium]
MRTIALRIEYDGTDFVGSQWQNNGRTVQGELEGAWEQLCGERQRLALAGRTDAGVHARGQVASVRSATTHDRATLLRGMNGILPEDLAVLDVWEVAPEFHARHSAIRREYRYLIDNGRVASALLRNHAVAVGRKLDVAAMDTVAQGLVGMHDFAAFCDGPQEGSTIRRFFGASCRREVVWGQPLIVIDVAANAFLRHMVRKIVGTLLLAGEGRLDAAGLAEIMASRNPRRAGRLVPAHGLYLMDVQYPGDGCVATEQTSDK